MKEIARLNQSEILRGRRSYVLRDDGTLVADYRSLGNERSHTLQIATLDLNPRRARHSEVGLLVVFLLFVLALLSIAFGAISSTDEDTRIAFIIAGIPLLILTIVCGVAFRKRSFDVVVFDSIDSPYLENGLQMCYQKPTREEFESFITCLQEQIREHQSTTLREGGIADQLRSLAKLRDEGILTEEEFAAAKERVISANGPRGPIGFVR